MATKFKFPQPVVEEEESQTLTGLVPVEYSHTVSLGPPIPSELLLGTLRDGRLRVCSPITVKITREDKHVIAHAVEFNEFGFGENLSQALSDLQRAIVELYLTLEKEQGCLGHDLQSVWASLQQKILKR